MLFRYCLKDIFKNILPDIKSFATTIAAVFPKGSQKEEIQQRRQARLRPEEKKTLNIMLNKIIYNVFRPLQSSLDNFWAKQF